MKTFSDGLRIDTIAITAAAAGNNIGNTGYLHAAIIHIYTLDCVGIRLPLQKTVAADCNTAVRSSNTFNTACCSFSRSNNITVHIDCAIITQIKADRITTLKLEYSVTAHIDCTVSHGSDSAYIVSLLITAFYAADLDRSVASKIH